MDKLYIQYDVVPSIIKDSRLKKEVFNKCYKFADEFMALQKKIKPLRDMSSSEKKDFFTEYENKILSSNNIQVSKDLSWKIWQEISLEKYSLRIFVYVTSSAQDILIIIL